jgi:2-phosphosulfolactate phosphatase
VSTLHVSVAHFGRSTGRRGSDGQAFVAIDVLRATTSIVCALAHGAREVIPVGNAQGARDLARTIDSAVLGGEERNHKIRGFDFGNSPQEYDARVSGKTIVMCTTNGTRLLAALRDAKPVWCAAFANVSSVARAIEAPEISAVTLVCAGEVGEFSLEDFACAGAVIDAVSDVRETRSDDEAIAARELFRGHRRRLGRLMEMSNHGRALNDAGMGPDVAFCARVDRYDVLPVLESGRIVCAAAAPA